MGKRKRSRKGKGLNLLISWEYVPHHRVHSGQGMLAALQWRSPLARPIVPRGTLLSCCQVVGQTQFLCFKSTIKEGVCLSAMWCVSMCVKLESLWLTERFKLAEFLPPNSPARLLCVRVRVCESMCASMRVWLCVCVCVAQMAKSCLWKEMDLVQNSNKNRTDGNTDGGTNPPQIWTQNNHLGGERTLCSVRIPVHPESAGSFARVLFILSGIFSSYGNKPWNSEMWLFVALGIEPRVLSKPIWSRDRGWRRGQLTFSGPWRVV